MNLLSWLTHPSPKRVRPLVGGLDMDMPLLYLSPQDPWRIRDSFEGTVVLGQTGSGKTSGSGAALARAFLSHGFGGVVLTAKPDERRLWEGYARDTGRSDSLIVIAPERRWRFNFLEYESRRPGRGGGLTENLTRLFSEAMEVAERRSAEREDFWSRAARQLLHNAIDLLLLSGERVTLEGIYDVIISAPNEAEELRSAEFQRSSRCMRCLNEGRRRGQPPVRQPDWNVTSNFWENEFVRLSARTRSCVVAMVTSLVDPLLRGELHMLFGTETNFVPEMIHEGAVVIVDLPVLEFGSVGQLCQVLFKFIFQRSTERRDVSRHGTPVFLWADEAQFFTTSHDAIFQSHARSARVATVYLSQSLPGFIAAIGGGGNASAFVHALLASLGTKIFHANACSQTNRFAAETIARQWQFRGSAGTSSSEGEGGGARTSRSFGSSEALDFQIEPYEFTQLRKGGPENGGLVEAIVFQGGRLFHESGKNHLKVTFGQG
jgi:hypothetical protein